MKCRVHLSLTQWIDFDDKDVVNLNDWLADPTLRPALLCDPGNGQVYGVVFLEHPTSERNGEPSFPDDLDHACRECCYAGRLTHLLVEEGADSDDAKDWMSDEGEWYDTRYVQLFYLPTPELSFCVLFNNHMAQAKKG